ncbi:hypothetical protein AAE478_005724 [Parahypoxylon ruwenzoriense]
MALCSYQLCAENEMKIKIEWAGQGSGVYPGLRYTDVPQTFPASGSLPQSYSRNGGSRCQNYSYPGYIRSPLRRDLRNSPAPSPYMQEGTITDLPTPVFRRGEEDEIETLSDGSTTAQFGDSYERYYAAAKESLDKSGERRECDFLQHVPSPRRRRQRRPGPEPEPEPKQKLDRTPRERYHESYEQEPRQSSRKTAEKHQETRRRDKSRQDQHLATHPWPEYTNKQPPPPPPPQATAAAAVAHRSDGNDKRSSSSSSRPAVSPGARARTQSSSKKVQILSLADLGLLRSSLADRDDEVSSTIAELHWDRRKAPRPLPGRSSGGSGTKTKWACSADGELSKERVR